MNKSEQKNCVKYSNNCHFNIKKSTRLNQDPCYLDTRTEQSIKPGEYKTSNYHSCICNAPNVAKTAFSQPELIYQDGYGWVGMKGCNIDNDSCIRNGSILTNLRCKNQLFEPPYKTTPYIARGIGNQCLEDSLLSGIDTRINRSCNTLSEVSINNYFQPLVNIVSSNQQPEHIVPEMVDKNWIRGGAPSRQIVRNIDYKIKCQINISK